jgi:D-3-phosphoglycerate dehydrogenase / 2-oxoglutarate reductase
VLGYPKQKINVLLLENIHPQAKKIFEQEGYKLKTLEKSLDEEALCEAIKDIHILGIRSKTQVTAKVIASAKHLWVIGAYCIGTNQIDLTACAQHGVSVFNAPYSNTRSVVELAIGEMIALSRRLTVGNQQMHEGKWSKTAIGCHELRGKTLGIVGYGNIGTQLSVLAESLGMNVLYYDSAEKLALGNAKKAGSLNALLQVADVVSIHVDGHESNHELIGKKSFSKMKKGALFLNLSRGSIVDLDALKDALVSEKLAGAGIDVYPQEPSANGQAFSSPLQGLDNVILTSHIGGSTQEAQEDIASFVPHCSIAYMNTGDSQMSVNFPPLKLAQFEKSHRLIHIHHNQPGVLASINELFAKHKINIVGQHLKTNETIGYVITDVEQGYDEVLLEELKAIAHTIRFRVLY